MKTKPLVIYHANCADGFGAAWAVHQTYPDAEFLPMHYGETPPDVAGRDVMIVDFSFKRPVLLAMYEAASSLLVLDHHKTAEAELDGLDFCFFDMNRSGAMIAWEHIHPDTPAPLLIDYIQDRDLWRWELRDSKEVSAYVATVPKDFASWSALAEELEYDLGQAVEKGRVALRVVDQYVESMKSRAEVTMVAGHEVPMVNTTFAHSELIGALAEGHPFAAGWFLNGEGDFVYSLRSRKGGVDVSEIAKRYGGGGHAAAAGFKTKRLLRETTA